MMTRSLILIASCLILLSACGFEPVYGTHQSSAKAGSAENGLDQVEISIIPNREGQYLRNALIDRFYRHGTPLNPAYRLDIGKINESISDFDITIESEATRRQLRLTTGMTLTEIATGKQVLQSPLLAMASHNVLASEFSTLVTEQSAREAALNDMARQVERQLALYFTR